MDLGMMKGCPFSVVGVDSNETKTVVRALIYALAAFGPVHE